VLECLWAACRGGKAVQSKSPVGIFLVVSLAVALAHPHDVVAGPCACNSDVSNLGGSGVNAVDIAVVRDCINGICGQCVNDCDIDCDGDVDYYDAGVVSCAFQGQINCCSEPEGACTGANNNTPACVNTTDNYCNVFSGTWHGDESLCVNGVLVPTVSTWGLLALGISILIAATLVIQRRALCGVVA